MNEYCYYLSYVSSNVVLIKATNSAILFCQAFQVHKTLFSHWTCLIIWILPNKILVKPSGDFRVFHILFHIIGFWHQKSFAKMALGCQLYLWDPSLFWEKILWNSQYEGQIELEGSFFLSFWCLLSQEYLNLNLKNSTLYTQFLKDNKLDFWQVFPNFGGQRV